MEFGSLLKKILVPPGGTNFISINTLNVSRDENAQKRFLEILSGERNRVIRIATGVDSEELTKIYNTLVDIVSEAAVAEKSAKKQHDQVRSAHSIDWLFVVGSEVINVDIIEYNRRQTEMKQKLTKITENLQASIRDSHKKSHVPTELLEQIAASTHTLVICKMQGGKFALTVVPTRLITKMLKEFKNINYHEMIREQLAGEFGKKHPVRYKFYKLLQRVFV